MRPCQGPGPWPWALAGRTVKARINANTALAGVPLGDSSPPAPSLLPQQPPRHARRKPLVE